MPRNLSPEDAAAWLRLSYAGLPTPRTRALLAYYEVPQAILDAAHSDATRLQSEFSLSPRALEKLRECSKKDVGKQLDVMGEHSIWVAQESDFPSALCLMEADTPAFLFVRGDFVSEDERTVAIVGTRNVTEYGRGLAHSFAVEFARAGWSVASGLARGIDTAAHTGALDGGGRTLAVTGCGLDIVYPSENRDLMARIEKCGAVVSEWAPTTPPEAWHFPARNRIIVGLARAVIVVEAQAKSGALITATLAAEHDRPVFAVPGNIHKSQSKGPHQLIKEGAGLMESVDDVLEFLGEVGGSFSLVEEKKSQQEKTSPQQVKISAKAPRAEPKPAPTPTNLAPNELRIWLLLEPDPRHMDDLADAADLEAGPTNAALVMLELKGFARRLPGNLFVKVA